MFDILTQ